MAGIPLGFWNGKVYARPSTSFFVVVQTVEFIDQRVNLLVGGGDSVLQHGFF
jgi:hypothetical protein